MHIQTPCMDQVILLGQKQKRKRYEKKKITSFVSVSWTTIMSSTWIIYHAQRQAAFENTGAIISTHLNDKNEVRETIFFSTQIEGKGWEIMLPYTRRRCTVLITPSTSFKLIKPPVEYMNNINSQFITYHYHYHSD